MNTKRMLYKTLSALTPSAPNAVELVKGSHFTELMLLPYYDCVRFSIIDPMQKCQVYYANRMVKFVNQK